MFVLLTAALYRSTAARGQNGQCGPRPL